MADVPPPMPPQQAKKPVRPRSIPVLKPAIRIITARTTRNRLIAPQSEPQDMDNDGEPS